MSIYQNVGHDLGSQTKGKLIRRFLLLGVTSFLSQISLVISMAAVQNMVTKYGAQDPVFGQAEYAQSRWRCWAS